MSTFYVNISVHDKKGEGSGDQSAITDARFLVICLFAHASLASLVLVLEIQSALLDQHVKEKLIKIL